MRRKSGGWCWAVPVLILSVLFLNACGGKDTPASVGPPATVTLSPALVSLNAGDIFQLTVSVLDAQGRAVFNQTVTFASNNPRIQVANNGQVCAGTWLDGNNQPSLTSPITCRAAGVAPDPPLDAAGLQANVTATASTITSAPISVFAHLRVTLLEITPKNPPCVPQAGTVEFRATAKNAGTDITASVGQINWQILSGQVATGTPLSTPPAAGGGSEPITVTAKLPGKTQIVATANTAASTINVVTSLPATFTECPIAKITVTAPNTTLGAAGSTVQLTAVATDTSGADVTNPAPTLTWSANPSAVTTVSATGLVTAQFAGTSGIVAGCVPTSCNIGLEPVYSEVVPITVSGTSATTVYATAIDGTTLIPISTANNTAGSAISLPGSQKKNSMVFSSNGARLFLGTDAGMLIIDANANTLAANVTNAPGKVLAVSADGSQALVSDVNAGAVRLFNGGANTVTNIALQNASAASFTPDGSKAYVAAGNQLMVLVGAVPSFLSISPTASDVAFLANGNAAYLNSDISRVRTCNNSVQPGPVPGPGGTPNLLRSTPDGKQIITVNKGSIDAFDVTVTPATASSLSACPTVSESALAPHATGSDALPEQLLVSPDSSKAFVTSGARTGSVLAYDVGANAAAGSPSTIPLTGGTAATTTGGITPDSVTLYVGGTDNNVHVIDIASGTDTAQVPLTFTPDFVAVRPR